ncbi:MAG: hypothetical protein PUH01_03120 [Pseudomonadota bacterium]|nr:hypothetical protein [Pseudomonadota bacterium]
MNNIKSSLQLKHFSDKKIDLSISITNNNIDLSNISIQNTKYDNSSNELKYNKNIKKISSISINNNYNLENFSISVLKQNESKEEFKHDNNNDSNITINNDKTSNIMLCDEPDSNESAKSTIVTNDNDKLHKTKISTHRYKNKFIINDNTNEVKNNNETLLINNKSLNEDATYSETDTELSVNIFQNSDNNNEINTISVKNNQIEIDAYNESRGLLYYRMYENYSRYQPYMLDLIYYKRTHQNALEHNLVYKNTQDEELKSALYTGHSKEYDNLPERYLRELNKLIKEGKVKIPDDITKEDYNQLTENVKLYTSNYYEQDRAIFLDFDKSKYEQFMISKRFPSYNLYKISQQEIDTTTSKLLCEYPKENEQVNVYAGFHVPRHEFFINKIKELFPDTSLKISRILDTPPHLPNYIITFHIDDLSFDGKGRDIKIQVSNERGRKCYIDNDISGLIEIPNDFQISSNAKNIIKLNNFLKNICAPITKEIMQEYLDTMLLINVFYRDKENVDKFLKLGGDPTKKQNINLNAIIYPLLNLKSSHIDDSYNYKTSQDITPIKVTSVEEYMKVLIDLNINEVNHFYASETIDSSLVAACLTKFVLPIIDDKRKSYSQEYNTITCDCPNRELLDVIIKHCKEKIKDFDINAKLNCNRYKHQDVSLLYLAIVEDNYDLVEYLLENGANVKEQYTLNKDKVLKDYENELNEIEAKYTKTRNNYEIKETKLRCNELLEMLSKLEFKINQIKESSSNRTPLTVELIVLYHKLIESGYSGNENVEDCIASIIKKFIENPNDFPILKLIVDKMGIQPDKINDYI